MAEPMGGPSHRYRFAGVELDEDRCAVRRDGQWQPVQRLVVDLVLYLLHRRGRVVPRDELLAQVWRGVLVSPHSVDQAIHLARRIVGDSPRKPRVIRTVRGRGFQFVAALEPPVRDGEDRVAGMPGVPLVGRSGALEVLETALRDATVGSGSISLVSGEPGIGKTRLLEEFANRARSLGARVHHGRAIQGDAAPPLSLWRDVLRPPGPDVPAPGAAVRALLAELAGPLVAPSGASGFDATKATLFEEVLRFLVPSADDPPVVVLLDDLQRADEPSLLLLEQLAARLSAAPLLVVAAYRDAELFRDPVTGPMLAALARGESARLLQLGGLSDAEVGEFLSLSVGAEVPQGTASELRRRTGGNPFFLGQLAPLLSGSRGLGDLQPGSRLKLPRTVREAVLHQLESLDGATRAVLDRAAVLGPEFDADVLAAILPGSAAEALQAVQRLQDVHLLEETAGERSHRFSHVLVRDAAYEVLDAGLRLEWHRQAGEALEKLRPSEPGAHTVELAHHFTAAAPTGCQERAIAYSVSAAELSLARLARDRAAAHYGAALALLEATTPQDPRQLCDLRIARGRVLLRVGLRQEGRELLLRAARTAGAQGDAERMGQAVGSFGAYAVLLQTEPADPERVELMRAALAMPLSPAHRIRVQTDLATCLAADAAPGDAEVMGRQAIEAARGLGDPSLLAYALIHHLSAFPRSHRHRDFLSRAREATRLADAARDPWLAYQARMVEMMPRLADADLAAIDRLLDELTALASQVVTPSPERPNGAVPDIGLAMRALMLGDFAQTERLAQRLLERPTSANPTMRESAFYLLGMTQLERGNIEQAMPWVEAALEKRPLWTSLRCFQAFLLAELGRREEAERVFRPLAAERFAAVPDDFMRVPSLALLADTCAFLGDRARARELRELLEGFEERCVVVGSSGYLGARSRPVGLLSALLGDWDHAEGQFRAAIETEQRAGCETWLARARLALARMLCARSGPGDRERARREMRPALETAEKLGMKKLAADLRDLAAASA